MMVLTHTDGRKAAVVPVAQPFRLRSRACRASFGETRRSDGGAKAVGLPAGRLAGLKGLRYRSRGCDAPKTFSSS